MITDTGKHFKVVLVETLTPLQPAFSAEFDKIRKSIIESVSLFPDELGIKPGTMDSITQAAKKQAEAALNQEKAAAALNNFADSMAKFGDERRKVDVKVDLSGAEPELEAFVWKLVERAQYGAVYEGQEFLIGLPIKI